MKNDIIILIFCLFAIPNLCSSQENNGDEISFDVNRIFPSISISSEQLNDAQTLTDLNMNYNSTWVREYINVEISTIHKGSIEKAVSKNDKLSKEQKENMNLADVGTEISVNVQYLPENTLKHNDFKTMKFDISIDPDNEAIYLEGYQKLITYIKENAISKIPEGIFKKLDFAAVKFNISDEGQIMNAHIFESSKDQKTDKLLLETICNMPIWKPAEYSDGTKVEQEFVLTVGDMQNCMLNLLNIHLD